ncbi:hypothetical protein HMPREF1162_1860 [ [[Propionibacterium] namnetense SK182B-JCVI]|uniref:Uncharacterized protein n=1 Tax=[Propionibacterium] namnetense SK182B-JCVI TaxID=1051006 RepID=F9NWC5_9ACTN|nr:hypothetical protein HMPREF1162_1860 [ [[Propionibacterium] namnetense SK182B-JCVI]
MSSEQLCATGAALLAANPLESPHDGGRVPGGPVIVDELVESQVVPGGRQTETVANDGLLVNSQIPGLPGFFKV